MNVFHGSTLAVPAPDTTRSKRFLDFGRAFYVTSFKDQAERWARGKAMRTGGKPFVSEYRLADDLSAWKTLRFSDDGEWLDFVCSCRRGGDAYAAWDIVWGKVADDDVFKTVDAYLRGLWDKARALEELRYARANDQIAFVSQAALDASLSFVRAIQLPERP